MQIRGRCAAVDPIRYSGVERCARTPVENYVMRSGWNDYINSLRRTAESCCVRCYQKIEVWAGRNIHVIVCTHDRRVITTRCRARRIERWNRCLHPQKECKNQAFDHCCTAGGTIVGGGTMGGGTTGAVGAGGADTGF